MPADVGELAAVAARIRSLTPAAGADRAALVALIAATQCVVNTATAVQDCALAQLAASGTDWAEDGTLVETTRPLGHVSIDAADLAAPALGATHRQAQRRTEQAVRIAAAREPVEDGSREVPQPSGLGGLAAAMRQGRLDAFRAGVVADELAGVPAAVAEAVIAAMDPQLDRHATVLRKRVRVLLGRISPDLLRQRAEKERCATGLVRWVSEPGVDTWRGTFPSEDAAAAWAAIDELARRHVTDGICSTVEQARGKALTDLVTAQATVTVSLVLTTPADTPVTQTATPGAGDVITGGLEGEAESPATPRPPEWLVTLIRARDGRCRFPGCSIAARFCDVDHVRRWPTGPTSPENLACLCRRHHRIKQRPGWAVRMLPGAVLEWTHPTGHVTTTDPQDALHGTVLPAPDRKPDGPPALPDGCEKGPGAPLEITDATLGIALGHALAALPGAAVWTRACARERRVTVLHARLAGRTGAAASTRPRRDRPARWPDEPPF